MLKRRTLAPNGWVAYVLLGLLLLAACGAPSNLTHFQATADGLTIALEVTASPKINTSEQFLVTLTDAQGHPVDGADVYLDLTMPAMPMGTNRPVAEAQGQGRYLASSAYTMTGEWSITVIAEVAKVEHRALFKLTVSE